jgi:hypothetical protein
MKFLVPFHVFFKTTYKYKNYDAVAVHDHGSQLLKSNFIHITLIVSTTGEVIIGALVAKSMIDRHRILKIFTKGIYNIV